MKLLKRIKHHSDNSLKPFELVERVDVFLSNRKYWCTYISHVKYYNTLQSANDAMRDFKKDRYYHLIKKDDQFITIKRLRIIKNDRNKN